MSWLRILISVVAGLVTITFIAEGIEFFVVAISSGLSLDELTSNNSTYFAARNVWWILLLKIGYSFLSGLAGGHVASRIGKSKRKSSIFLLILIQFSSILWAAFFSELKTTGPLWMWLYLLIVIPAGIYVGHYLNTRKK